MIIYLSMIDSAEDQCKFEVIYERYKNLMFYVANSILHSQHDAEDIVHDAFLKIIEIIGEIDDPESPKTKALIVTITEHKAIDLYRKHNRKTIVAFDEAYIGFPEHSQIQQIIESDHLAKAIATLPSKYREVLLLRYYQGYSMEEIAAMLSISRENVKKRIQRARSKLSELLDDGEV